MPQQNTINNYTIQEYTEPRPNVTFNEQVTDIQQVQQNQQISTLQQPKPEFKALDNYTNILNTIIMKEKLIDEKMREFENREKNFMEFQIKKKDMDKILSFDFQHILIDTRKFEQPSLNAYVYNFIQPIQNVERIQILNISIPVLNYNIASKQYFEYYVDDVENSIHIPRGNYNINQLLDVINKRNNELTLKLNSLSDCIYVESKRNIKIKKNYVSKKLGLDANTIGTRPYDLRIINYLTLYIKNLFQEKEVCKINPLSFTPIDIMFNEPSTVEKLEIEFRDVDNNVIDFEGRHHMIELRIFWNTRKLEK